MQQLRETCPSAPSVLWAGLLLASLALTAGPAAAHGGMFNPPPPSRPGGEVPTPEDPRPPPPPHPGREPPPLPPAPATPGRPPDPTAPPPPSAPEPSPGPGPGGGPATPEPGPGAVTGRRTPRVATVDLESSWETWWVLNRLALLPSREEMLDRRTVTPGAAGPLPEGAADSAARRALAARGHVIPFLLRLLDPAERSRDDVVASALLALAKVAQDREVIALLRRHLEDSRAAHIVRESAALSLGLLRRSDPAVQFAGVDLDRVRDELLRTFDDRAAPTRTRAFCALAVGLLGDQPFGSAYTQDGRLAIRDLWTRLERSHAHADLPVALLTALALQPPAGVPDGVREGLRSIVAGRRVLGRRWDPLERSHALTASIRLGGHGTQAFLLRVLGRKRESAEVRRAAFLALGPAARQMTAIERRESAQEVLQAIGASNDPLTRGLGHVALGLLVQADLRAGDVGVLAAGGGRLLLAEARSGSTTTRGFSALALALACRGLGRDERAGAALDFAADAGRLLQEQFESGRGEDRLRSAYAVALGLTARVEAVGALRGVVSDAGADPVLRGHAAVAIGQIGHATPESRRALHLALADRRDADLRRQAALGLALLGGELASTPLLRELATGRTERLLAQVVIALGRLGDLQAVPALTEHAADRSRSEFAQALAVVALGLLTDPEGRPSLLRLTEDANYPARTDSLHEAFTIL